MSLLSQKDREMAIEALEFYVAHLKEIQSTPAAISSFSSLLAWVELEHFKNDRP
jgi:hypothetical protein